MMAGMYTVMGLVLGGIFSLIFISLLVFLLRSRYKRAIPGWVLVVKGTGAGDSTRDVVIVKEGGRFVLPFVQTYDALPVDVKTFDVLQYDIPVRSPFEGFKVNIKSTVQMKISENDEMLKNAAAHLLGLLDHEIKGIAQRSVQKYIIQVCSDLDVETVDGRREMVAEKIRENGGRDLAAYGIELISVRIKDVEDNLGYLAKIEQKRRFLSRGTRTDRIKGEGWGSGFNEELPIMEGKNRMRALALHEYALHLLEKGEMENALNFFNKACNLDPDEPMYRKDLDGCRDLIKARRD